MKTGVSPSTHSAIIEIVCSYIPSCIGHGRIIGLSLQIGWNSNLREVRICVNTNSLVRIWIIFVNLSTRWMALRFNSFLQPTNMIICWAHWTRFHRTNNISWERPNLQLSARIPIHNWFDVVVRAALSMSDCLYRHSSRSVVFELKLFGIPAAADFGLIASSHRILFACVNMLYTKPIRGRVLCPTRRASEKINQTSCIFSVHCHKPYIVKHHSDHSDRSSLSVCVFAFVCGMWIRARVIFNKDILPNQPKKQSLRSPRR